MIAPRVIRVDAGSLCRFSARFDVAQHFQSIVRSGSIGRLGRNTVHEDVDDKCAEFLAAGRFDTVKTCRELDLTEDERMEPLQDRPRVERAKFAALNAAFDCADGHPQRVADDVLGEEGIA